MEQDISNGNRNDFNWKNKLEDVSNLPDAILADKIATWEKLHSRLHEKRPRIKTRWYWLAAACLLFVIIIPVIMRNKSGDLTTKNSTKKVGSKQKILPAIVSSKENTVVNASAPLHKKKTIEPSFLIDEKMFSAKNIAIKEEPGRPAVDDQADIITDAVISPAVADSNRSNALAVASVKKKLKVVHINELNDSFSETPNVAAQYEHSYFQLKLINRQAYTGTSLPSGNTGFTIFKTSKASSN